MMRAVIAAMAIAALGTGAVAETVGNWRINRFAPEFVATARAAGAGAGQNAPAKLTIACRRGVAEISIATTGYWGVGPQYWRTEVEFRIDSGPPVTNSLWYLAPDGKAATLIGRDSGERVISVLPATGTIAFRISTGEGAIYEAAFALDGLATVRSELAKACKAI